MPVAGEIVVRVRTDDNPGIDYRIGIDAQRVVVPEPATGVLLALGLLALARLHRRRR